MYKMPYNAISLFSGAMGLDLGIERAGFDIRVCVEMDKWAVETIRSNTDSRMKCVPHLSMSLLKIF